jgi:hypothetical protein
MHCGQIVTDKRTDPAQYKVGHVHTEVTDSWGWDQVVIVCADCLDLTPDEEAQMKAYTEEQFIRKGISDKPVNKNYGYQSLKDTSPQKADELREYLESFGYKVKEDGASIKKDS